VGNDHAALSQKVFHIAEAEADETGVGMVKCYRLVLAGEEQN